MAVQNTSLSIVTASFHIEAKRNDSFEQLYEETHFLYISGISLSELCSHSPGTLHSGRCHLPFFSSWGLVIITTHVLITEPPRGYLCGVYISVCINVLWFLFKSNVLTYSVIFLRTLKELFELTCFSCSSSSTVIQSNHSLSSLTFSTRGNLRVQPHLYLYMHTSAKPNKQLVD